MILLRLRDVVCVRGGRTLFEGIDLTIGPGAAVLVTGANGAGKSSLLRIAAGLLMPTRGAAERVPAALADARPALDEELPLGRALGWWTGRERAAAALDRWDLGALAGVPVRLLSTGQRQRANLARATAGTHRLWLLDEPANGLDVASCGLLEAAIAAHRAAGGAVAVATHQPVALPDATAVRL